MTVLRRVDGVQFVINPYRTILELEHVSQLQNVVKQLTQSHGQYIRLIKKSDNRLTAVLSADPGFLLGEAIWQHFQNPDNLVYCEVLSETSQAILVIVTQGTIVFDNVIEISQVISELKNHINNAEKYAVYTFGDVPINVGKADKSFNFNDKQIVLFNHLAESLYIHLTISEQFQLLPVRLALQEHQIGKSSALKILSIVLFMAIAISSWYLINYLR